MADSLNVSFIKVSEDKIQEKLGPMLEFFEKRGHKPGDPFDDNLWFFDEINQDHSHYLWTVISQTIGADNVFDENVAAAPVIETFVQKLIDSAKVLHQKIVTFQQNIDYFKDDVANFQKYTSILDQNQHEYGAENALVVSYVDQVTQISEIQKFYKLRYKIGTVHQNYQAVPAENSNRSICLNIDPLVESVTLVVMGKRLDKNLGDERTLGEDFKELAQIIIPISDIYQTIRPRHFALPTIPQCYLKVNYQDHSLDAPYTEDVTLNLRFDVRLTYEERKLVAKSQLDLKKNLLQQFESKLKEYQNQMKQLLVPFKDAKELQYVTGRGIGLPKDLPSQEMQKHQNKDKNKDEIHPKSRDSCCVIS